VKVKEEVKTLECNLKELSGVWEAECCESRRWNKGDLIGSTAHNCCNFWYKRSVSKSRDKPCKKSDEAILPMMAGQDKPVEGRVSTSIKLNGKVSEVHAL
jgi:hypothetical protein